SEAVPLQIAGQLRRSLRPLHALIDPAEDVLAQKEQHSDFAIAAVEEALFQALRVGAVARNQTRQHERRFGIVQQRRGRHALVERVQNQRRQLPHRLGGVFYGRHVPTRLLISAPVFGSLSTRNTPGTGPAGSITKDNLAILTPQTYTSIGFGSTMFRDAITAFRTEDGGQDLAEYCLL